MGSQVTCVLEIPEPCYIDSTPSFLDGPSWFLGCIPWKFYCQLSFEWSWTERTPCLLVQGLVHQQFQGTLRLKMSWNLDPKWLYHPERFQKQGRKVYIEYVCLVGWGGAHCFCWGGWQMEKGGMKCFLFFWMVASTCSSWWFQPPWKKYESKFKTTKRQRTWTSQTLTLNSSQCSWWNCLLVLQACPFLFGSYDIPRCCMYGIFTYIFHKTKPNVNSCFCFP